MKQLWKFCRLIISVPFWAIAACVCIIGVVIVTIAECLTGDYALGKMLQQSVDGPRT
jgi:hypothetical protein